MVALASPEICLATPSGTPKIQPYLWQQGVRSDSIPPTPDLPAVQYCPGSTPTPHHTLESGGSELGQPMENVKSWLRHCTHSGEFVSLSSHV